MALEKELISVIIPLYNADAYLSRCLDSVLNNTYQSLQIICIDDGSTDNSRQILEYYCRNDPRILVVHTDNHGVSMARNEGLKRAAGQWISFIDSDDWIHPHFFETLLIIAQKTNADIITSNIQHVTKFLPFEDISTSDISPHLLDGNPWNWSGRFYVTGRLFKREIVINQRFDETIRYGEDTLFNINIIFQPSIRICCIDQPLYYYYDRAGSLSSENKPQKRAVLCQELIKRAVKEIDEDKKQLYLISAIKRSLSNRYDALAIGNLENVVRLCNDILADGLRELKRMKHISNKEKLTYAIFTRFPAVYRFWRVRNDPSLLEWEKRMKNQKEINTDE